MKPGRAGARCTTPSLSPALSQLSLTQGQQGQILYVHDWKFCFLALSWLADHGGVWLQEKCVFVHACCCEPAAVYSLSTHGSLPCSVPTQGSRHVQAHASSPERTHTGFGLIHLRDKHVAEYGVIHECQSLHLFVKHGCLPQRFSSDC